MPLTNVEEPSSILNNALWQVTSRVGATRKRPSASAALCPSNSELPAGSSAPEPCQPGSHAVKPPQTAATPESAPRVMGTAWTTPDLHPGVHE